MEDGGWRMERSFVTASLRRGFAGLARARLDQFEDVPVAEKVATGWHSTSARVFPLGPPLEPHHALDCRCVPLVLDDLSFHLVEIGVARIDKAPDFHGIEFPGGHANALGLEHLAVDAHAPRLALAGN